MKYVFVLTGLMALSSAAHAGYETIKGQIVKGQSGPREIRMLRDFQYDCIEGGIRTVCNGQEGDIYKLVGMPRMVDPEFFTLEDGDVAELAGNIDYSGREVAGDGVHEIKTFYMFVEDVKVISRRQILLFPEAARQLERPALEQSFLLLYVMRSCSFQLRVNSRDGGAILTSRSDMAALAAQLELQDLSTGEPVTVKASFANQAYLRTIDYILPDVPRRNRQVILRSRTGESISSLIDHLADRVSLPILEATVVCQ